MRQAASKPAPDLPPRATGPVSGLGFSRAAESARSAAKKPGNSPYQGTALAVPKGLPLQGFSPCGLSRRQVRKAVRELLGRIGETCFHLVLRNILPMLHEAANISDAHLGEPALPDLPKARFPSSAEMGILL